MKAIPLEIQAARWAAVDQAWPLGHLAYALQIVPVEKMAEKLPGPWGVDNCGHLYFDPDFTKHHLTAEERAGAFAHEIFHLLLDHAGRAADMGIRFDPSVRAQVGARIWNIAADCEINQRMLTDGWTLPEWVVTPEKYGLDEGKTAEVYYRELCSQPRFAQTLAEGASLDEAIEKMESSGEGEGQLGSGRCGSCATGVPEEWETKAGKNADGSQSGMGKVELDDLRRAVAKGIQQQVQESSEGRGTDPGWLKAWAEEYLTPPRPPWHRAFRGAVARAVESAAGRVDYTWRRLSRRQVSVERYQLPGMHAPRVRLAVVVDTSGSMSDEDLALALTQISQIVQASGVQTLDVLAVDAAVAAISRRVLRGSQVRLEGRGGTDMRIGIEAALKLKPKPQVVVVLTDGETPWPNEPIPGAWIVCGLVCGRDGAAEEIPDWIRVVEVCDE